MLNTTHTFTLIAHWKGLHYFFYGPQIHRAINLYKYNLGAAFLKPQKILFLLIYGEEILLVFETLFSVFPSRSFEVSQEFVSLLSR
jgi:hypothetical protein